jgi:hypothetical protein
MFKQTTIALAAASALILSGCATTSWHQPPDHPADPGAAPGITQPMTSLDRYRSHAAQTATPEAATGRKAAPDETDHSGHHMHGESQP